MNQRIAIASDHGGFDYKSRIAELLTARGITVLDFGVDSDASADYPEYATQAARAVSDGRALQGILVCGSGIGVSIVANKIDGIRAANCTSAEMARLAREHNDANVLALGQRIVAWEEVERIVDAFLSTDASAEDRHRRRVGQIHSLTGR